MKKGTYRSRRRARKVKRFFTKLNLSIRVFTFEIMSLAVGLIFRVFDKLFRKQIRIVKRGEGIYEGIKN